MAYNRKNVLRLFLACSCGACATHGDVAQLHDAIQQLRTQDSSSIRHIADLAQSRDSGAKNPVVPIDGLAASVDSLRAAYRLNTALTACTLLDLRERKDSIHVLLARLAAIEAVIDRHAPSDIPLPTVNTELQIQVVQCYQSLKGE